MKFRIYILFAVVILSHTKFCLAMDDSSAVNINSKKAEFSAMKLQQKILLTDQQANKIGAILSYFIDEKNFSQDNSNSTLLKVEIVLDQRQKAKFDIIKAEWWESFLKSINYQMTKQ